ncbi:MAG: DUF881 domain-containing protein [Propioniciclava sp.]
MDADLRHARKQRPDASMDLLNTVREQALELEYGTVAHHRRRPSVLVIGGILTGVLLGLAGASSLAHGTIAEQDRVKLISRIEAADAELAELHQRVDSLSRQNRELELTLGGASEAEIEKREELEVRTGRLAVAGPGVLVTLDDGRDHTVEGSEVVDADVRIAVNGLWRSGAEAVSVNGHRVTGQTAIRNAGDAITVNYRSLSTPYHIAAIGDPEELAEGFPTTAGGRWLAGLEEHYGITWDLQPVSTVEMGTATGPDIKHATRRGE